MDSWVILWFSIMLTLLWGQGTKVNPPGMWARVLTKYYLYRITTKVWNGSLHFFIEASLPDTHLLVWSKPTESFEIDNTTTSKLQRMKWTLSESYKFLTPFLYLLLTCSCRSTSFWMCWLHLQVCPWNTSAPCHTARFCSSLLSTCRSQFCIDGSWDLSVLPKSWSCITVVQRVAPLKYSSLWRKSTRKE